MEQEFAKADWYKQTFLNRIGVRSDIDGDSAFCLQEDASAEDFEFAKRVKIFSRLNGGDWTEAPFTPRQAFVWFISPAWHYSAGKSYHHGFQFNESEKGKWNWEFKAVVSDEPFPETKRPAR